MTSERPSCPECGYAEVVPRKQVRNNEVVEEGRYCPECQTEYDEDTVLQWDQLDSPIWIHEELRLDNWALYDTFHYSENFHTGDYNGAPSLRDMKCWLVPMWFKVNEDGSVEGPYDEKGGELL